MIRFVILYIFTFNWFFILYILLDYTSAGWVTRFVSSRSLRSLFCCSHSLVDPAPNCESWPISVADRTSFDFGIRAIQFRVDLSGSRVYCERSEPWKLNNGSGGAGRHRGRWVGRVYCRAAPLFSYFLGLPKLHFCSFISLHNGTAN